MQVYLLLPILFNIVQEVLAIAVSQENQGIRIRKEEIKLLENNKIVYSENTQETTKQLLELNDQAMLQDIKLT